MPTKRLRRTHAAAPDDATLARLIVSHGKGRPRHERVKTEAAIMQTMPWRTPSYDLDSCARAQRIRRLVLAVDPEYFPDDDHKQPRVVDAR